MTQKKRIVSIVGVGALLISAVELGIDRLNHDMRQLVGDVSAAAPKAGDMFKGALGRRLLEHRTTHGVRADPETVNAQLQNGSGQETSKALESLIVEYQRDPQKFHRYAQVFDTWLNAMKIANASVGIETSTQAESSSSVSGVILQEKLDAWGHALLCGSCSGPNFSYQWWPGCFRTEELSPNQNVTG
jgi:hypothetical protein